MKTQLIFELHTDDLNAFFNALKAALIEYAQPYAHDTDLPVTIQTTDHYEIKNSGIPVDIVKGRFFLSNERTKTILF